MVRKPKTDWKAAFANARSELGGDLPILAEIEADVNFDFEVFLPSIEARDDLGPDSKWSGYLIQARDTEESKLEDRDGKLEIPFWARKDFDAFIDSEGEQHENGWLGITAIRSYGIDGKNRIVFK